MKVLKDYIVTHGVPGRTHIDQGTNFTSNYVKTFCNTERIEIRKSPVNDHCATGCVERTIGSFNHSILTYAKMKNPGENG